MPAWRTGGRDWRQVHETGSLGSHEIRCVGAARNQDSQRGRQAFERQREVEEREREVLKREKINVQLVEENEPLFGSP